MDATRNSEERFQGRVGGSLKPRSAHLHGQLGVADVHFLDHLKGCQTAVSYLTGGMRSLHSGFHVCWHMCLFAKQDSYEARSDGRGTMRSIFALHKSAQALKK